MILFNDCVSMGDTLLSFPAMKRVIQRSIEPVYLHWTNEDLAMIFPRRLGHLIDELPPHSSQQVLRLSVHDFVFRRAEWREGHDYGHLSAALYYQWTGESAPADFIRPEIEFPITDVPAYDFVLVPFALADAERNWCNDRWRMLIEMLRSEFAGCSIALAASTRLRRRPRDLCKVLPDPLCRTFIRNTVLVNEANLHTWGVDLCLDLHIFDLCTLLTKVKVAAITVDTGPSRLMHAIGRPHVLLAHNTVGYDSVRYPGVRCLWRDLKDISVDDVMNEVKAVA